MRTKLNAAGQVTLPAEILDQLPLTDAFEIELGDGVILLKPIVDPSTGLERIRGKMRGLGHSEMIVQEAVTWARSL
jgi:bifunctional DNA-binding transcriptional regulator/antitoxin component of YhaV-PrlF toxin-antitoxin module